MKLLGLAVFMLVSAQAFAGSTIVCKEINATGPSKKEVIIKELENVTNKVKYGRNFDAVYRVKVTVLETQRGSRKTLRTFEAFSKAVDVTYNISSVKKDGFSFWRYLDEENEDGFDFIMQGKRSRYNLNCKQN